MQAWCDLACLILATLCQELEARLRLDTALPWPRPPVTMTWGPRLGSRVTRLQEWVTPRAILYLGTTCHPMRGLRGSNSSTWVLS